MTTEPRVLHVVRPYASVDDYVAAEAWTIDVRSMLLIDAPPLELDTAIIFDVTLRDGSRPIKAEARVTGTVQPHDGRPGGLRVRFKRYGAPTKAFIERAVASLAEQSGLAGPAVLPSALEAAAPSATEASAPSASEAVLPSATEASAPSATEASLPDQPTPTPAEVSPPMPPPPAGESAAPAPGAPTPAGFGSFRPVAVSPSGSPNVPVSLEVLRARNAAMPETPANREYLLEKLRQRLQGDDVTMRYQRD